MTMPMTIHLHDLTLEARLGVFEWERANIRPFPCQVEVKLEVGNSAQEDDLTATLDYSELETLLRSHTSSQEWQLIERLIDSLAEKALKTFPIINEITLTIDKPAAIEHTRSVAVTYNKKR